MIASLQTTYQNVFPWISVCRFKVQQNFKTCFQENECVTRRLVYLVIYHVKIHVVEQEFQTWLLTGWQHSHQPIRTHMQFLLTHLPLEKMAAILADDNFKCILLNENDRIPSQISLKFVSRSPIDNKPALVQVMACRRTGDKLLPELMLTQFTDTHMQHYGGDWLTNMDSNFQVFWENLVSIHVCYVFRMILVIPVFFWFWNQSTLG